MTIFDDLKSPGLWQEFLDIFRGREIGFLQVEISSYCTGKCVYCPHTVSAGNWKSRYMKSETFANLWPLMCRASRVHLQGWGEPFLHPHFMDFTKLALRAGCQVSTTTCGLYMNEAVALQIVDSGIDVIAFSLAGTSTLSNKARDGIPFDQVANAVQLLQSVRKSRQAVHLEIHLAYLLLASNLTALWDLPELMNDWGVHATIISTLEYNISSPQFASEAFLPHELDKIQAARAVINDITVKARATGKEIYASLPDPAPSLQCREQAQNSLYVDAEGVISPCVFLNIPTKEQSPGQKTKTFGSVNVEKPLTIWAKSEYRAFREALGTPNPDRVCENCSKRFEKPF